MNYETQTTNELIRRLDALHSQFAKTSTDKEKVLIADRMIPLTKILYDRFQSPDPFDSLPFIDSFIPLER